MKVPTYDELLNPTLRALRNLGGSASIQELTEEVLGILQLPQEVVDVPHGNTGKSEVEYRLAWARSYLKDFGLLINSARGVWALTPEGRQTDAVEPEAVKRHVRQNQLERRSRKGKQRKPRIAPANEDGEATTPADELESVPWQDILHRTLMKMSPGAFERLCQWLLRESGFIEVKVTGRTGDEGIDGHGIVKLAGLLSFPIIFQAKRYSGSVGAGDIRNFRGAMVGRADKGLFITTGSFTSAAYTEATRDGAPPIDLIDGKQLAEKLKELELGVKTKVVEAVEVDTHWFLSI